jgi:uncharacterized protein (TIGR00369 family)
MTDQEQIVPEGFEAAPADGGFFDQLGPYYYRREPDGSLRFGLRLDQRHMNMRGVCHGGVLVSFLDQILGKVAWDALEDRIAATVHLATDFMAPALIGDWIEGDGEVTKMTKSLLFPRGRLLKGDQLVATGTGIWKVIGKRPAEYDGV